MRTRIPSVAGLTGALLLCTAGWAATPDDAEPADGQRPVLDDAVRVALRCELAGNDVDRNTLLQHVLEQDPEFAPARWHLGQLKVNDREWVPCRRFVDDEDERWHQLYLYRKDRDERDDTVTDHFSLANGARERGMWDEERAHLMRIVELDWDNQEGRRRLGDVKIDGFWVTREEIDSFAIRLLQTRRHRDDWAPDVEGIVRRLVRTRQSRERAWEDLAAIRDPAAIPAVESALSGGDERGAQWYLEWLRGLDAWEASVALARQAVFSPSAAVRTRAQLLLRDRRIDDYAPVMLAALRDHPRLKSRIFHLPFGGLLYVEETAVETQFAYRTRHLAVLYGVEWITVSRLRGDSVRAVQDVTVPGRREAVIDHLRRHYGGFSPREGRTRESTAAVMNNRIMRTLERATEFDRPDSPQDWWEWWNVYQHVDVKGVKPLFAVDYDEAWYVDRDQEIAPTQFTRQSCFAAGTPVVTEYGPKPIEKIVLGDRVLAQDVDSGEIAFKPVFNTTIRPPVQLLKVTTEDGELTCTAGHPFWINGLGWRYAWELEPGMRFHSVDGSSEILSVEDSGRKEKAYNLVVADYHNYFVGEGRILSHDNSPRNPTNALVPGLMPDWSAAVPPGN